MAPSSRPLNRFLFYPLLVAISAASGAATLTAGSADVKPNDANVGIALALISTAGEHVSGIQFDLVCSENVARLTAMQPGPVAVLAGKSVSYNRVEQGRYRAIVAGLNQNVIGDGEAVSLLFEVTAQPPDGPQPISIEGLVMSDPNGRAVPSSAVAGELRVTGGVPPDGDHPRCGCTKADASNRAIPPQQAAGALAIALFSIVVLSFLRRCPAGPFH